MHRNVSRRRSLAVAAGTALGFVGCGAALLGALDLAGVSQPVSDLDVTMIVEQRLADCLSEDPHHERARVFVLGDSTSVPVPEQLELALEQAPPPGPPVQVTSLVVLGQTTYDQYFLSSMIADARPDAVVIGLHLAGFSESWRTVFARPQLAGWLPFPRALEALRLPLHRIGLSTDELFFHRAVVAAGGADAWRALVREQVRVGQAARDVETWLARALGVDDRHSELHNRAMLVRLMAPGNRFTLAGARRDYAAVLDGLPPDHAVLEMLGALVGFFTERGVATLVAVMPINVDHLQRLGLLEGSALPRSLAEIEARVVGRGGAFLDLHDALPDAAFADAMGHYRPPAPFEGARVVGARLAPAVTAVLARKPG
jgi:hypothetical protein